MMLEFDKEIDRLERALGTKIADHMAIAVILAGVLDRGMAMEQARIINIIKHKGMNPLPLIEAIRKPIR